MKMFLRGVAGVVAIITLLFCGGVFLMILMDMPTHLSDAAIGLWLVQQVNVILPVTLLGAVFTWLFKTLADLVVDVD